MTKRNQAAIKSKWKDTELDMLLVSKTRKDKKIAWLEKEIKIANANMRAANANTTQNQNKWK
jgi:hypothetical protein